VAGTGDSNLDVPAVQAAVDQGGRVVLTGHFSPMVTVSKEVVISGRRDENGEMPTIEGENWPFFIDAMGAPTSRLRDCISFAQRPERSGYTQSAA
jgi:hypothetical protein